MKTKHFLYQFIYSSSYKIKLNTQNLHTFIKKINMKTSVNRYVKQLHIYLNTLKMSKNMAKVVKHFD